MRTSTSTTILFATLLGLVSLAACKADNPLYCADSSACKTVEAPICDTKTKACRACGNNDDCVALDPTKPACVGGQCVACGVNADCKVAAASFCEATTNECRGCSHGAECAAVNPDKPVCLATKVCAGCDTDADCKSRDKPVCDAETKSCRGCTANAECGSGVCGPSGACVGCVADTDCKGEAMAVCDKATNTCRGCSANAECAAIDAKKAVCGATGVCVECNATADCKDPTKPICNTATHACRGCQADSECPADPGVCMAHTDGHCAVPAETIFVLDAGSGSCNDTPPAPVVGGTKNLPFCSLKAGLALVTPARSLVVVSGDVFAGDDTTVARTDNTVVSIVGQSLANLTTLGTVLKLTSGSLYMRALKLHSAFDRGITATGGTLRMDGVTITGCVGGGLLLDGAAFDIRNTVLKGNGTSDVYTTNGIRVEKVSANGPKLLTNVTITDNLPANLSCGAVITGTGVLAPGSETVTCGFGSCVTAGPTCGAP